MNLHYTFAPGLLGQDAAAYYLSVSPRTLNELQAQGHIIPKKVGNARKFRRVDLDALIDSLPDWEMRKAEGE